MGRISSVFCGARIRLGEEKLTYQSQITKSAFANKPQQKQMIFITVRNDADYTGSSSNDSTKKSDCEMNIRKMLNVNHTIVCPHEYS